MDARRGRVLLVDDDDGIREAIPVILADHYDVTTAASGKPAIAALLATIQGVSVVGHGAASIPTPGPHEIVVVDGQPDMDAVLRQIDQARPAMASVAPRMGILARRVVQGIAISYQSATVEHLADVAGCSARHLSHSGARRGSRCASTSPACGRRSARPC
jgi:CheY-like chemotaxis protein